jgi:hypothetical protein
MRLTRITLLLITLIMGAGFYRLSDYLLEDLETQTLQATEESMIDAAHILANLDRKRLRSRDKFLNVSTNENSAPKYLLSQKKRSG